MAASLVIVATQLLLCIVLDPVTNAKYLALMLTLIHSLNTFFHCIESDCETVYDDMKVL